ncbi:peroxiredoxin family protein [Bacillus sp. RAR_GA_16]|uniref:peroxiredoxin family protein n=1 Tax=Bacillus sp. RAR_GA_16 TaxID=2876774 RepID=UPI001CCDE80B|nr:TlpA disulfide reductase family protein [Bacillus sp. RAR_GA_16]MCA0173503.1 TlpA family protein disulfide reductase [Bacillus sp. RAR_GA_16]
MKRLRIGIGTVIVLGFLAYSLYSTHQEKEVIDPAQNQAAEVMSDANEIGIQEGKRAPDFTLYSLEGKEVSLSDYKDKVIFINFWATWCPPCKEEIPDMQKFYEEEAEQLDAEILAINLTTNESSSQVVKDFAKKNHLTFPILMDTEGQQMETFVAITIPTTYVIDKNGIIMKRIIGPMNKEMMIDLASSAQ